MKDYVIVDTSVWIDFFNGRLTAHVKLLFGLMDTDLIIVPPVILQEVLQGINNKEMIHIVEEIFMGYHFIAYDSYEIAFNSAELYRSLRQKRVAIRSSNDAVITILCMQNKAMLLHNDKDFNNIAKHTSLKIYK